MSAFSRRIKNVFSSNPKSANNAETVEAREIDFYRGHLKHGMIVLDVGANVGDLTALFGSLVGARGQVHAFEPGETAFARLRDNVQSLPTRNVTLNSKAVGETDGKVKFHVYPESHSTWNTMAKRPLENYGIQLAAPAEREVGCVSLDSYCATAGLATIDLLKIDVEGAELQVLRGCRQLFLARRIRCCTFEFGQTTFDMGTRPEQFEEFFREVRYDLRNLIPGDPLFPGGKSAETAQFAMLLATPGNAA